MTACPSKRLFSKSLNPYFTEHHIWDTEMFMEIENTEFPTIYSACLDYSEEFKPVHASVSYTRNHSLLLWARNCILSNCIVWILSAEIVQVLWQTQFNYTSRSVSSLEVVDWKMSPGYLHRVNFATYEQRGPIWENLCLFFQLHNPK